MRISREAACLRTYNKMLPDSAAKENHVTPEEGYNTVNHCADIRTTCPNIPNDAPNCNKLYEDDCKRVCGVFDGIRHETLDVPAICFLSPYSLAKPSKSGTTLKKVLVLIGDKAHCVHVLVSSQRVIAQHYLLDEVQLRRTC